MAVDNSNKCYSCGKNEPEYLLDDRPLCCDCYNREKKHSGIEP